MKTWTNVEKAFQDAGINYQQKDWIFFCEINEGKFYYSPQSGKWRVKRTRAWQPSNSIEDFIAQAYEYLLRSQDEQPSQQSKRENKEKKKSKKKSKKSKSKKTKKSKTNYSNRKQNRDSPLIDEVRPEFLELFDEKIRVCNERNYKPAWIWMSLLDKYLLTPSEICWLCTVFDYSPGWAFHKAKDEYPELTYQEILANILDNRSQWLNYFNRRWQFSSRNESKQEYHRGRQQYEEHQKRTSSSTQSDYRSQRYRNYLDLLALNLPFSKQELKIAYRKKALVTHPDTGGTAEAFRRVHIAFEILSPLAS